MGRRMLDVAGRKVLLEEGGEGAALFYLHGIADVHGVAETFLPVHRRLCESAHVIAPAHPGCAGADDLATLRGIDDVVFHYLEVIDALGLDRFDLVGHSVGGWIAAELAVRHPEKIRRLVLVGACGLSVPGHLIGDVFMHSHPDRGVDYGTLRHLLFASADSDVGKAFFPDGRGDLEDEVRRYAMLRFGSFVGFRPPYFYNRALRERLHRAAMPALVLWGEHDHMVPPAHGEAYAAGLPGARGVTRIEGAGHAALIEQPDASALAIRNFLS